MDFEKNREETMVIGNVNTRKGLNHTAEIIHEIRNPLTTVKGFLQLIKPYLKEIGKEQYADVALSELNRVHQLINDYLQGSKSPSYSTQNISLNQVIKDLALLYESETFIKNIQLTLNLSNQDAVLKIPESRLKQVLINMINNAIEVIDESNDCNRNIDIATITYSGKAVIKITDTCGGLSKETIGNLFVPYNSSKKTGTGIGLCICKKIIEDSYGTIDVECIPGKQTTFTISFPSEEFTSL